MTLKQKLFDVNKKRECLEARLLEKQASTTQLGIEIKENSILMLREEMELNQLRIAKNKTDSSIICTALQRLTNGSYGICVCCHQEIASERLDALPETPFCTSCSETRETEAQTST